MTGWTGIVAVVEIVVELVVELVHTCQWGAALVVTALAGVMAEVLVLHSDHCEADELVVMTATGVVMMGKAEVSSQLVLSAL